MAHGDETSTQTEERVRQALERRIGRVRTPARAEAVVRQAERLASGTTEAEAARRVEESPTGAATAVERAGGGASPTRGAAGALVATGAEAVAVTPEASAVAEAAQKVMRPGAPQAPAVQHGRRLLREAVLRRMTRLDRLDANLFVALNRAGHVAALDRAAAAITIGATGGWIWSVGMVVGGLIGVPGAWSSLGRLIPCVVGATLIVELPVKAVFKRRRPFVNVIRAVVVGKKPGSWSFPSGHSASSFAAAWTLVRIWPRRAPLFFGLAGLVALSRVYVGAHYPGDVTSGALFGMVLAELIGRLLPKRQHDRSLAIQGIPWHSQSTQERDGT